MPVQSTLMAGSRLPPDLLDMIFAKIYYDSALARETMATVVERHLRTGVPDVRRSSQDEIAAATEGARAQISQVQRDLASCALVCRAFNCAVAPWLFRDFKFPFSLVPMRLEATSWTGSLPGRIKYEGDFDHQYELVDSELVAGKETTFCVAKRISGGSPVLTRNIPCLIDFLESHKAARLHIHSLTLVGHWTEEIFATPMESVAAQDLLKLLHMLPRLRNLALYNVPVQFWESPPPLTACGPLETLSITFSSDYYSQRDFLRVMHCFGEVTTLKLNFPGYFRLFNGDEEITTYEEVALPIRPRSVKLNCNNMRLVPADLMNALFKHSEVLRAVTTLQLEPWEALVLNAKTLLDPFKPTLSHLVLGIDDIFGYRLGLNFPEFVTLETLELRFKLSYNQQSWAFVYLYAFEKYLQESFSAGPALRTLTLRIAPDVDSAQTLFYPDGLDKQVIRFQLDDHPFKDILRSFALARRFVVDIRMVVPSEAGAEEEEEVAWLLRGLLPDTWQELSPWLRPSLLKGDKLRPLVAPEVDVV